MLAVLKQGMRELKQGMRELKQGMRELKPRAPGPADSCAPTIPDLSADLVERPTCASGQHDTAPYTTHCSDHACCKDGDLVSATVMPPAVHVVRTGPFAPASDALAASPTSAAVPPRSAAPSPPAVQPVFKSFGTADPVGQSTSTPVSPLPAGSSAPAPDPVPAAPPWSADGQMKPKVAACASAAFATPWTVIAQRLDSRPPPALLLPGHNATQLLPSLLQAHLREVEPEPPPVSGQLCTQHWRESHQVPGTLRGPRPIGTAIFAAHNEGVYTDTKIASRWPQEPLMSKLQPLAPVC